MTLRKQISPHIDLRGVYKRIPPPFNKLLNSKPRIKAAINWEFPAGAGMLNFSLWPDSRKAELSHAYDRVVQGNAHTLPEVMPMLQAPTNTELPLYHFYWAWQYYIWHVSHCLAIDACGQLPWSIENLSDHQIEELLSGTSFFRMTPEGRYQIPAWKFGGASYSDPSRVYDFIRQQNLIGKNQTETIANTLGWCRNLSHYVGSPEPENMYQQWQYSGLPPVERIINGTIWEAYPAHGVKHRTAGCWGTTGFLRALLRLVNIPVKQIFAANHAITHFLSISRYLSHGDDPYSQLFNSSAEIPDDQLLINQTVFDDWFVADPNPIDNVGRQPRELALQYLTPYLLREHCQDIAAGNDKHSSRVAELFSSNYTVAQLEAMNLWGRMDQKIAALGGCSVI